MSNVSREIAGSVPDSLLTHTNLNVILQVADEIQAEDPNVARIRKLLNRIVVVFSRD